MSTDDKGKFSTSIGDDVIAAAMRSVDKAKRGVTGEVEVPIEVPSEETAETAAEAPPASAGEVDELKEQLEISMAKGRELMAKLKDEHERLLRATADLENYRKRAAKEKEEVAKFGSEKLLRDFLPIYDNFDRALDAAKSPQDFESFKMGVQMIKKLFEDGLGKHQVKFFSSVGKPFDPNLHEAMSQAESADMPPNHVHSEMVKAVTLNERLIRPALVVVSRAPVAEAEAPAAEAAAAPEEAPNDTSNDAPSGGDEATPKVTND